MKEGDLVAGRYRLLRPIGAGAMGKVWAARHELLERDFAVKLAGSRTLRDAGARERFLREARTVAKLRHPNVVDVADVGEATPGGDLYIAMELLVGASLADRITERGKLHPREAVAVAAEVARGLGAAHEAGVVHRDVKPENVFLARGAAGGIVPKLLDFGVSTVRNDARYATLSGQLLGTPAYMSPEQALGETNIDEHTDVWSLGVVLYEMLTARHPFQAPTYQALLPRIAETPHIPMEPDVPEPVRRIVDRCLAKARADRYPSAGALAHALDTALEALEPASGDGSLYVERARTVASIAPGGPPASGSRAFHGTLSPSIHPVRAPAHGRTVAGVVVAGVIVAAAVAAVSLVRRAPEAASAHSAEVTSAASKAPPPADSAVTASAPEPPGSAEPPPATEPARAPARPVPRRGPRPVTRVNSAGF